MGFQANLILDLFLRILLTLVIEIPESVVPLSTFLILSAKRDGKAAARFLCKVVLLVCPEEVFATEPLLERSFTYKVSWRAVAANESGVPISPVSDSASYLSRIPPNNLSIVSDVSPIASSTNSWKCSHHKMLLFISPTLNHLGKAKTARCAHPKIFSFPSAPLCLNDRLAARWFAHC